MSFKKLNNQAFFYYLKVRFLKMIYQLIFTSRNQYKVVCKKIFLYIKDQFSNASKLSNIFNLKKITATTSQKNLQTKQIICMYQKEKQQNILSKRQNQNLYYHIFQIIYIFIHLKKTNKSNNCQKWQNIVVLYKVIRLKSIRKMDQNTNYDQGQLQEVELEMLVEQCQELISKLSCTAPQQQSQIEESFSMRKQKNRLEKQFIDLCLQIERQQKQLQSYKFKMQVAQKEAQYYTRQIKEKQEILDKLQIHRDKKMFPK